jgi:hypothetical protein
MPNAIACLALLLLCLSVAPCGLHAQIVGGYWISPQGAGLGVTCHDAETDLPAVCTTHAYCTKPPNALDGFDIGGQAYATCPLQHVRNIALTVQQTGDAITMISEGKATALQYNRVIKDQLRTGDCYGHTVVITDFFDPNGCDPPPPPPPPICGSPIIIDTAGEGFHLTSAKDGVVFDLLGDGSPLLRWAWTAVGSRNAFLALDRNDDNKIESGKELFGNFTPQSDCAAGQKNGFRALAEYDLPENGGNGDGVIDARDAVFEHLRLWIDKNHDGVSQPGELYKLPVLGVTSLGLEYTETSTRDQFGNWFRFKGQVNPEGQPATERVDRTTFDVYLRARTLGDPIPPAGSAGAGTSSAAPAGAAGVDLPCCNCGG